MRFTTTARLALTLAQREASLEASPTIDPRHLFMARTQLPIRSSTASRILSELGIATPDTGAFTPAIHTQPQESSPGLSLDVKRTLERAVGIVHPRFS